MSDGSILLNSDNVYFLESINLEVTDINIEWGSPHPDKGGSASISSELAQRVVKAIKAFEEQASKEFEIVGKLIGANLRTMRFEMEIEKDSITGDIDEEARMLVDGAILGDVYIARIREIEIYKPMIEESSLKFHLISLQTIKSAEDLQ